MIDKGSGTAVVLIPGIQGRWEWISKAIDSLSNRYRVITDSPAGDQGSIGRIEPLSGFESYVTWLDKLLDQVELTEVTLCGISYGGLIALHHAAHRPQRVRALILVSAPGPMWKPNSFVERYLKAPRLLSPFVLLSSSFKLYPELVVVFPNFLKRIFFGIRHFYDAIRYPLAPSRIAQCVRLLNGVYFLADCQKINAPTMVVTGEKSLDHVVPVDSTLQCLNFISGATHKQIEGTGHLGLITATDRFCNIVGSFVAIQNTGGRD